LSYSPAPFAIATVAFYCFKKYHHPVFFSSAGR